MGVIKCLRDNHIRVPDEISVETFVFRDTTKLIVTYERNPGSGYYPYFVYSDDGTLLEFDMFFASQLSATPDESYFSTAGLWKMPLWLYNAIKWML